MRKPLIYILSLIILTVFLLPKLYITMHTESFNNVVINSIKISEPDPDIKNYLMDKQIRNIKVVVFDDTFLMDNNNYSFMKVLTQKGYESGIILDLSPKGEDYFNKLSQILAENKVRIVYFEDRDLGFDNYTFMKILELIKKNGAEIGLMENMEQNGLQNTELKNYTFEFEDSANKALYTKKKDIEGLSSTEISFRLLRSVVDRGIRLNLLEADKIEDLKQYDDLIGQLNGELISKGYRVSTEVSPVKIPVRGIIDLLGPLAFSIIAIFCLTEAAAIKKKIALFLTVAYIAVILTLFLTDFRMVMIVIALAITIVIPATGTLVLYKYITDNSCKGSFVSALRSHVFAFAVYIISGLFIWFSFSDYIFRIGFETYKLALVSYIAPIIILLTYILRHEGYSLKSIKKALCNKKYIAIMLLSAIAAAIYLSRSGNFSLFPATPAELYFRMFLERIMPVRPRLKEFLLGYPALFLLFAVNRRNNKAAFNFLLILSSITGISLLNTFCHGFTAVNVSLTRALLGFVLGTLTGAVTYFLFKTYFSDRTW